MMCRLPLRKPELMCGGCVRKCVAVSANIFRDINKAAGYQRLYDFQVFRTMLGGR